jgi:hypothetical protein
MLNRTRCTGKTWNGNCTPPTSLLRKSKPGHGKFETRKQLRLGQDEIAAAMDVSIARVTPRSPAGCGTAATTPKPSPATRTARPCPTPTCYPPPAVSTAPWSPATSATSVPCTRTGKERSRRGGWVRSRLLIRRLPCWAPVAGNGCFLCSPSISNRLSGQYRRNGSTSALPRHCRRSGRTITSRGIGRRGRVARGG